MRFDNRFWKIGTDVLNRLCNGPTVICLAVSWLIMQRIILPQADPESSGQCGHAGLGDIALLVQSELPSALNGPNCQYQNSLFILTDLSAGVVTAGFFFGLLIALTFYLRNKVQYSRTRISAALFLAICGFLLTMAAKCLTALLLHQLPGTSQFLLHAVRFLLILKWGVILV